MDTLGDPSRTPEAAGGAAESSAVLLDRIRRGDSSALNALLERYLPALTRWAHGRLPASARDSIDTHDLVQDALMRSLARLSSFEHRGPGALHAYLRQAVMNRIRDELRRARPQNVDGVALLADRSPTPLERAIGAETLERYERALLRLRPIDREAIVARLELDFGYDELAALLGRPTPEAARLAVRRALLRLAEEMARA